MEGLAVLFTPGNMTAAGGIVATLFAIYKFSGVIEKLMGNHVNHNTEALHRLADEQATSNKNHATQNEILRRFADILERKLP